MSIPSLILSKRLLKQRKFRELLLALMLLTILLGILVVPIEQSHPQAKITNTFDGIYWAFITVTSVGYGDMVTVTTAGKLLSILLSIVGAMMYGIIVAMIGSYINRSQEEYYWGRLFSRLDRLEEELDYIKKHSDYIVKNDEVEKND